MTQKIRIVDNWLYTDKVNIPITQLHKRIEFKNILKQNLIVGNKENFNRHLVGKVIFPFCISPMHIYAYTDNRYQLKHKMK